MREIKFRGINNDGNWCFGDLIQSNNDHNVWIHAPKINHTYKVAPATVGQFTGLCDCEGKEIYEGDILLYRLPENMIALNNSDKSVVFYGHGMFLVSHGKIEFSVNQVLGVHGDDAVVIGNVYENPEMLEAKDLMRELDDVREYADCERQLADELKAERDHARKCAEEMRDLYAAEIDESIAAFPFPWEDEHGADRDGE